MKKSKILVGGERNKMIETIELALAEFRCYGKVVNVQCNKCNHILSMSLLGGTAIKVECACGKFNDILRGI